MRVQIVSVLRCKLADGEKKGMLFRFDMAEGYSSVDGFSYSTPGWQRAQRAKQSSSGFSDGGGHGYQSARQKRQGPLTIEGELVAKSVSDTPSQFSLGERVFHIKFGYGAIKSIEGNKLTIDFEKAGVKKVIDSFVLINTLRIPSLAQSLFGASKRQR